MQCDPWGTCKLTWQHWHLFQQDSCQLLQNSPQAPKTILQGQVQGHIAVNGPVRLQAPKEEGAWYRGTAAANGQNSCRNYKLHSWALDTHCKSPDTTIYSGIDGLAYWKYGSDLQTHMWDV